MRTCPSCGEHTDTEAELCPNCGARFDVPPVEGTQMEEPGAQPSPPEPERSAPPPAEGVAGPAASAPAAPYGGAAAYGEETSPRAGEDRPAQRAGRAIWLLILIAVVIAAVVYVLLRAG